MHEYCISVLGFRVNEDGVLISVYSMGELTMTPLTHMHARIRTHTHTHTHACMYIRTHMHARAHTQRHTQTHTHTPVIRQFSIGNVLIFLQACGDKEWTKRKMVIIIIPSCQFDLGHRGHVHQQQSVACCDVTSELLSMVYSSV